MLRSSFALVVLGALVAACSDAAPPGDDNGEYPTPGQSTGNASGSNGGTASMGSRAAQRDIPAVDAAMQKLMATYSIPGADIAITKGEKLVYAKAYGTAGASDAAPVTNESVFRIASLSKPFTSAAIMRLVEQGKLTMQTTVFGSGGILSDFTSANVPALSDITIDQLLHHTTGNWPNDGNDPMMQQPSLDAHALIEWALDNVPDQGKRGQYAYSNFGFCILGRVIEKISGKTYEQFVKDEILEPAGITDMSIAGNTAADRKPNEVAYSAAPGDGDPYGLNVARMDSHGGWLASATDLMRFLVKVDGFSTKPDLLQPATEALMTTPSASNQNYACGWAVNANENWWHTGKLPGSTTELVRGANGFNWAILTNGSVASTQIAADIDALLWPIVNDASTPWEDVDQF